MDPEDARGRLEEERVRLAELRETEHPDDDQSNEHASFDQHTADLGTETFERERDLSVLEQIEAELADVEHALARLDEGTYGTCEACGQPIPDDRLEALPATRFCVKDQAQAEREVATRNAEA